MAISEIPFVLAAFVVDFTMHDIYSISLRRDLQMAKLMTVQDWIPTHHYPEPIFLLKPFPPGINSLTKVYVKDRESVGVWLLGKCD